MIINRDGVAIAGRAKDIEITIECPQELQSVLTWAIWKDGQEPTVEEPNWMGPQPEPDPPSFDMVVYSDYRLSIEKIRAIHARVVDMRTSILSPTQDQALRLLAHAQDEVRTYARASWERWSKSWE